VNPIDSLSSGQLEAGKELTIIIILGFLLEPPLSSFKKFSRSKYQNFFEFLKNRRHIFFSLLSLKKRDDQRRIGIYLELIA
jgi:hypothetical protein